MSRTVSSSWLSSSRIAELPFSISFVLFFPFFSRSNRGLCSTLLVNGRQNIGYSRGHFVGTVFPRRPGVPQHRILLRKSPPEHYRGTVQAARLNGITRRTTPPPLSLFLSFFQCHTYNDDEILSLPFRRKLNRCSQCGHLFATREITVGKISDEMKLNDIKDHRRLFKIFLIDRRDG